MTAFRVPGFVWVIVIALLAVAAEQYAPDPWGPVIVIALFGILKALNLDTRMASEIMDAAKLQRHDADRTRSIDDAATPAAPTATLPPRRSLLNQWFWG